MLIDPPTVAAAAGVVLAGIAMLNRRLDRVTAAAGSGPESPFAASG